jgi:hypothetical protein
MGIFLVWGMEIERTYGTAFYASLNIMIGTLSNLMSLAIQFFVAYYTSLSYS